MHGTDFHCVEVVFATVTATRLTKWVERLTEEGFFGRSPPPREETWINVYRLVRGDGAAGLGKKSNLQECCSTFPWVCHNSLLYKTFTVSVNMNETKTIRGPLQMWKECSFGNLPPGPGDCFPLRIFFLVVRTVKWCNSFFPDTIWTCPSCRWVCGGVPPAWMGETLQTLRIRPAHARRTTFNRKSGREWANICYFLLIWGFYTKTIRDH